MPIDATRRKPSVGSTSVTIVLGSNDRSRSVAHREPCWCISSRSASGSGTTAEDINKLIKMHRGMADMMKAMATQKRGPMAGLAQMMGFGGGMPSPEEIQKLAAQGGLPQGMPGAPQGGGMPAKMPGLPPNFPGTLPGGLAGLGSKIPGLGGFPGPGKKK